MRVTDLIPWRSGRQDAVSRRGRGRDANDGDPFGGLQLDINRAFDGFMRAFDEPLRGVARPDGGDLPDIRVDVKDKDDAVVISAELPGMDEGDVEVIAGDDAITIRGETSEEDEEEDSGYLVHERRVGFVERTIPLPEGVDATRTKAKFRNGILMITVPKTAQARSQVRRIPVQA